MPLNAVIRNELAEFIPEGVTVMRQWLLEKGYSRHSIDNLVKSQQLHVAEKGVYVRGHGNITWAAVVYSLQCIGKTDLVIGGLTALEMQGLGHYLSLSDKKTIHLFGTNKLPNWVNKVLPDVCFTGHSLSELTGANVTNKERTLLHKYTCQWIWREEIGALTLSTPERAFLEVLADVPQKISFEHADQLMQGLTNLSPRSLQQLLEHCATVKVRRLFFWLADRYRYPWLEKINRHTIDMGKGKRLLVKGGKLDHTYQITVPEYL